MRVATCPLKQRSALQIFFNLIHVPLYLGDSPKLIADIKSEVEGYLYSCFGLRQAYDIGIMGVPLSK
jgi:hypothetical protein